MLLKSPKIFQVQSEGVLSGGSEVKCSNVFFWFEEVVGLRKASLSVSSLPFGS